MQRRRVIRWLLVSGLLLAPGGDPRSRAAEVVTLPVTMDNSIVMVEGEWEDNAGDASRIRIKGNQHIVAMAFDTAAIAGRRVVKATLVCHQGAETIAGVTISTIAVPWDERASNGLTSGVGDRAGWGYAGGRFPAVCGGNSHTLLHRTAAEPREGRYHWDVHPDLVQALTLGIAHGLAIHEHDADYRRNPTIFSREQSAKKPVLLVEVADSPAEPPEPAGAPTLVASGLDSAVLELTGPAHGFAYEVSIDGARLGQHDVPLARPGERQRIVLRDLPTAVAGRGSHEVEIVTLGRTGARSRPARLNGPLFRARSASLEAALRDEPSHRSADASTAARGDGIGVIPVTDKYDAAGLPVGDLPAGHRDHNAIFDGRAVRLTAAAGEVVGFQVLLRGTAPVTVAADLGDAAWRVDLHEARFVPAQGRLVPDPLVPLPAPLPLRPDADAVVVVDVFVPFGAPAGVVEGEIVVSDGRRLPVSIEVLPWSLPRKATFLCEMNSYGLPDRVQDYEALQRVAYDHRVHVNILHYSHGTAAPGARKSQLDMRLRSGRRMDNRRYDDIAPGARGAFWDDFAEAFGPVLDGSLFADGHRGPVPVPGFYLTFHESWPLNCRAFFDGNPDAFEAFRSRPEYARTWVAILEDFTREAVRRGWTDAGFQVYLNNKGSLDDPKKSPWILDEPTSFWDYRALGYFGTLVDQGRAGVPQVRVAYRVDISRPEFTRGQLAGRRDLWVVSSAAFGAYRRLVDDRLAADGLDAWVYGTANHVHESNRAMEAWALDAWTAGASGIVPWQTVDKTGRALSEADQLGLFIFDRDAEGNAVIRHSLRLKAFREAEQLIEHLARLEERMGWTREETRAFVRHHVALDGTVTLTNADDAGTPQFGNATATSLTRLRAAVVARSRR